jgi:hypothetical protein
MVRNGNFLQLFVKTIQDAVRTYLFRRINFTNI